MKEVKKEGSSCHLDSTDIITEKRSCSLESCVCRFYFIQNMDFNLLNLQKTGEEKLLSPLVQCNVLLLEYSIFVIFFYHMF